MLDATQVKTIDDAVDFFNEKIVDAPEIVPTKIRFKPLPFHQHLANR